MGTPCCFGYGAEPFATLVTDLPTTETYPVEDFRVEWGPIFHRGRLDGSAKVLVLGQDPATHEAIARRILIGEAGQRVQGLLAKVGITRSYVMINTFLYSVYGQGGGNRHAKDPAIAAYRNRWLDALLVGSAVSAVVTFGQLAERAYTMWCTSRPDRASELYLATLLHPTYPESAARAGQISLAEATTRLLSDWNDALPGLAAHLVPDGGSGDGPAPPPPTRYGDTWLPGDLQPLPPDDLPPGSPSWWRGLDDWAARTGADSTTKRATITVTVPAADRSWLAG